MTNLVLKIQSNKSRLEIAHNALKKVSAKLKYSVEEITNLHDSVDVGYYVSGGRFGDGEWDSEVVTKRELIGFINDFYNNTIDTERNGEHFQYTDTSNPADYLEENLDEVVSDYLNNRKDGSRV